MTKKVLVTLCAAVALAGCSGRPTPDASQSNIPTVPMKKTIQLNDVNKSGQGGTATLEEINGKVKVSVTVGGSDKNPPRPANLNGGNCPSGDNAKYPLKAVVNGKSETDLPLSMQQLLDLGSTDITISASNKGTVVACGNIKS